MGKPTEAHGGERAVILGFVVVALGNMIMENGRIRFGRIYNFLLFHATLVSLLHIYIMIIYYFTKKSGPNLLSQCQVLVVVFQFQKIT